MVNAAVLTVDTTVDDATPGNCSLREAVLSANANLPIDACTAGEAAPVVDTIRLGSGVYRLAIGGPDEDTGYS
jgi:CSLREA domain-containing protein